MPNMVRVGDEINSGMFPTGRINFNGTIATQEASWQAFGIAHQIGNSRRAAQREVGPAIQVAIHGPTDQDGEPQYFFQKLSDPRLRKRSHDQLRHHGIQLLPNHFNRFVNAEYKSERRGKHV